MTEVPTSSPPGTRRGLKTKVILSMLLVGVIPLVVGLGMAFWQGSQEIREVSGESFKALATEAARKLDLLLAEEIAHTARTANDPAIIRALEQRRDAQGDPKNQTTALTEFERRWMARDAAAIKSITDNPLSTLLHEYFTGVHSAPGQLLPTRGSFLDEDAVPDRCARHTRRNDDRPSGVPPPEDPLVAGCLQ